MHLFWKSVTRTCFNPFSSLCKMQDMSATVMEGNGQMTGHIISTTIGGKNGEPKQVRTEHFFK